MARFRAEVSVQSCTIAIQYRTRRTIVKTDRPCLSPVDGADSRRVESENDRFVSHVMSDEILTVEVDCYAGYEGEETPRRFSLGARWIVVEEVLDRWLAPDHRYFKLRSTNGHIYIVRHDVKHDRWELTLFEA